MVPLHGRTAAKPRAATRHRVTTKFRENNFDVFFPSCGSRNSVKMLRCDRSSGEAEVSQLAFCSNCGCENSRKKSSKIERLAAAATRGKSKKLEKKAATRKK